MCSPSRPDAPEPAAKLPEAERMPDVNQSSARNADRRYRQAQFAGGTLLTGNAGLSTPSALGRATLLSGLNG